MKNNNNGYRIINFGNNRKACYSYYNKACKNTKLAFISACYSVPDNGYIVQYWYK